MARGDTIVLGVIYERFLVSWGFHQHGQPGIISIPLNFVSLVVFLLTKRKSATDAPVAS